MFVHRPTLQEFVEMLMGWMIRLIPGGTSALGQFVSDGKSLRGSVIEAEESSHRFVAQDTAYARALDVALAFGGLSSQQRMAALLAE
jgi:hypothetical protein